jgi:hypothetical protein
MEFNEHTLLNDPDLTLILLKTAARGETGIEDCVEVLRSTLERAGERPPVARTELVLHLDRVRRSLMRAHLLAPTEGGRFRITERGRNALKDHPMGLDDTVLMEFPEFREFVQETPTQPSAAGPHSRDYAEGYLAFRAGKGLADNPHAFETAEHLAWENGWFQARDEEADRSGQPKGA